MFLFSTKKNNVVNVNEIKKDLGKISLIDIREPYEYSSGHIPTAKNIPMNVLLNNPEKYLEKNNEYYIVCQSGARSALTCKSLSKQGFNVVNVIGGTGSYIGKLD